MKKTAKTKKMAERVSAAKRPTVGARIIEGLEQAIAWSRGQKSRECVSVIQVPEVDGRDVRRKMGLTPISQKRRY